MRLNSTSVLVEWCPVSGAHHYTIYYNSDCCTNSVNVSNVNESTISGLHSFLTYEFRMSLTMKVNEILYEGAKTLPEGIEALMGFVKLWNFSVEIPTFLPPHPSSTVLISM